MTKLPSLMAIRVSLKILACVSFILVTGAVLPSAADPLASDGSALEFAAIPPSANTPDRLDLLGEREDGGTGSSAEALREAPGPAEEAVAPTIADPWVDAFAGSRLGAVAAVSVGPPYPIVLNPQVRAFLDRFTGNRREVVELWWNRSGRYLDMIRGVLRRHQLPEDLAFMAMIESGFDPLAVSRAGAKGLWQFMAATARRYGLRVDQWVDERLDPEKATVAAAAYLRDLHAMFGSWTLAQAAYNAGEVKVSRAIRATGSTDFWMLIRTNLLRRETKEFVPQIHAATLIGRNPDRYGFDAVTPVTPVMPVVETVAVPPGTDLRRLSVSAGISHETLRLLNPVLVRGVTPPGARYDLRVPEGSTEMVAAGLAPRPRPVVVDRQASPTRAAAQGTGSEVHVVRPRDTVTSIARRYGVTVGDVLRWNSLEKQDRIRPGDRLRVAGALPASERHTTTR